MLFKALFARFIEKSHKQGVYTALDAMKLFAIFNMTIDHVGAYFFPEDMWWRAIGRITFPVWFFLVGYSRSRTISRELVVYAILLAANHLLVGRSIFPLNALVSVILCRLILNWCNERDILSCKLPELLCVFIFGTFFTIPLFEYGSIAFMFALFGQMVRGNQKENFITVSVISYITFVAWQLVSFKFNMIQSIYVILGTAWVVKWLADFPNNIIWDKWENSVWKTFIAVLSRNTMVYYFVHRLAFEIGANILNGNGLWFIIKLF